MYQQEEKDAQPDRVTRFIQKEVEVTLTQEETLHRGQKVAAAWAAVMKDEFEAKKVAKEWKEKIDGQYAEITKDTRAIETGKEYQKVEVEEVRDFQKGSISWWHRGSKVEERAMTAHELQMEIPVDGEEEEEEDFDDAIEAEIKSLPPAQPVAEEEVDSP